MRSRRRFSFDIEVQFIGGGVGRLGGGGVGAGGGEGGGEDRGGLGGQ